jgi:hypothetical protein
VHLVVQFTPLAVVRLLWVAAGVVEQLRCMAAVLEQLPGAADGLDSLLE